MRQPLRFGLLAPLLLLPAVAGCAGGGDSDEDTKARIAGQLVEGGLSDDQAACVTDVLVEEIGISRLRDVDFSADEPPEGMELELAAVAQRSVDECDLGATGELEQRS